MSEEFQTAVQFKVEDVVDMTGLQENSVDLVVSCLGIFLVHAQEAALKEIDRVLKPDGVLAATAWTNEQQLDVLQQVRPHTPRGDA